MNETTASGEDVRDEVRRHIINSLNAGLSLPAAVRAAIDAGFDEILAQQVGRELREDITRMKKRQALRAARNGVLWMLGAIAAAVVLRFTPLSRFGDLAVWVTDFALLVAFIAGIVKIVRGLITYVTTDSRIN